MTMQLSVLNHAAIVDHAWRTYPYEACGLLIGRTLDGRVCIHRCVPTENVTDRDLQRHFVIAPDAFMKAQREVSGFGMCIVGVYHSHPDHDPWPSQTDANQAWPGLVYVICATNFRGDSVLKAWMAKVDGFDEVVIETSDVGEYLWPVS